MKQLLISVHDITPRYAAELELIFSELERRGVCEFLALIEPNREGRYPVSKDKHFIARVKQLRDAGAVLAVHGYHHSAYEFGTKDRLHARNLIKRGQDDMRKAFGGVPKVFIPPMWRLSSVCEDELASAGYAYTENLTHLIDLKAGTRKMNIPLGMEGLWSAVEYQSAWLTKWWTILAARVMRNRPAGVIRFSFHPREVNTGNIAPALAVLDSLLASGWKPTALPKHL